MPTNRKKLKRYRKTKLTENLINFLLTGEYDFEENDSFDIFLIESDSQKIKALWQENGEKLLSIWPYEDIKPYAEIISNGEKPDKKKLRELYEGSIT